MARVARTAFSMDSPLRIFRAVRPSRAMRHILSPVSHASRNRSEYTAGTRAEPGRAMPRTSARQHMVLAVPKKEQDPQVGAHKFSRDRNSSSVMRPAVSIPRASCRDVSSVFRPSNTTPPRVGPPVIMMAGISSRAAAMSIPGTILSQDATRTRASRWCASATSSMESAMTSLWGRMKCIPRCPSQTPSQEAMTPNSAATPPALWIPFFTCSLTIFRLKWPGTRVFQELAMPITGLSPKSPSQYPMDFHSARAPAFWGTAKTSELLHPFDMLILLSENSSFSKFMVGEEPAPVNGGIQILSPEGAKRREGSRF